MAVEVGAMKAMLEALAVMLQALEVMLEMLAEVTLEVLHMMPSLGWAVRFASTSQPQPSLA